MHISIIDRALLRGLLAGAVVLVGTAACSSPDRADAGNDTNQPAVAASPADTQLTATTPHADADPVTTGSDTAASASTTTAATEQGVSGYQPMAQDTVRNDTGQQIAEDRGDTVAVGDSAQIGKPGERLEGTQASEQANEDTLVNQADSGRIRPPEDSSETSGAAVGATEMARDTGVALAQGDTVVETDTEAEAIADTASVSVAVDTATTIDTAAPSTAQAPSTDSSTIQVSVDTTTAGQQREVAVEHQPDAPVAADTAVVVGDSAEAGKPGERLEPEVATAQANADTVATDAERVRPPEDSTEVLGNVTTGEPSAQTGNAEAQDAETVGAAGIESTGNAVTGANAVAQMSRQGQDCHVVVNLEEVRFDMASSPATLNPCGTGTMTLPRIVTGEE